MIPAHVLALRALFGMQKRSVALVSRTVTVDPTTTNVFTAHPRESPDSKPLCATTLLLSLGVDRLALIPSAIARPAIVVGQSMHFAAATR